MTSINILPIELLDIVFHHVHTLSLSDVSELPAVPDRILFPLNVGAVCTLWLRVLKSHPQFWQSVVIDVALDPAPFLDMLGSLTDGSDSPLDLIVFSSDPSINKYLENSRTRVVFEHLEPVIARYTTITFRLVYQSSLPCASEILLLESAQYLSELFLLCTTYDRSDNDADDNEIMGAEHDPLFLGPAIPTNLRRLSLTGFDLFNLCYCGSLQTWQYHLQLSITHYKFRKESLCGTSSTKHFAVLMQFLHDLSYYHCPLSISFSDISLGYRPSRNITSKYAISLARMSFANVSADFISAFFSTMTLTNNPLALVSFQNCVIPCIAQWHQNISVTNSFVLELADIPFNETTGTSPERVLRLDRDDSLYNAIEAFPPNELQILRCEGVTDRFLQWLSGDNNADLDAPRMVMIKLHDCANFTAQGVCTLLLNRRRRISYNGPVTTLERLEVFGEDHEIYEGDFSILKEYRESLAYLWNVEPGDP
ncbi:hypothetical protein HYPSUDRAFT_893446 [Hypholoma sublateritium FD-334 SS-4]|uniref:F-box domain-containing protein n=1 Tax=Hypholoma sublateritium (strain FD-334 SS-4) TaxID=945553 RepID=A0A0D2M7X3_HYPSF|nr:hypothetical protein HYPSUDRAFT_893446 [Hypholoma sublateritium FD-334 SS-4]